MAVSFRPPRPWVLTEEETINSFANWQSNLKYYISLNDEFAPYLTAEWQKASTAHHGLQDDAAVIANAKTGAQKAIILDRMLGIVAQYSPSLLRNDIMKKSTSLASIWTRIRKYYSFQQSEVNFLKLSKIRRKEGERYETLFQRIIAHLEDNLLTIESNIIHDGETPTVDETLSPTAERLAVYLWMTLIDNRLPDFVARQYAHDLQTKSIKEIQPMIVDNMDALLAGIAADDDVNISYTSSKPMRSKFDQPRRSLTKNRSQSDSKGKSCVICKLAGRKHDTHDISTCWHLSKIDRLAMAKTLKVEVNDMEDDEEEDDAILASQVVDLPEEEDGSDVSCEPVIRRVQCSRSPTLYMFYREHSCHCLVDTGGQSALISYSFVQRARIKMTRPTQGATQLDKTPVPVLGEVHITISYAHLNLPLSALVVDVLDTDILLGVPFCEENDVTVSLGRKVVDIKGLKIPYGQKGVNKGGNGATILRNTISAVVYPGDFLEVECKDTSGLCDGDEVSIEPHIDSPCDGMWPSPVISRVVNNVVRIPNNSDAMIRVSKSQHVGIVRRLISPDDVDPPVPALPKKIVPATTLSHSALVTVDPNNQLSSEQRRLFDILHQKYDAVFDPKIEVYNDYSGPVRAHVNIGPVKPPPRKTRIPSYSTELLQELQTAADELEELGVLAKPEDLGITVQHASPSLLLREGPNKRRMVTTFNDLSPYIRIPPTASSDCNSVLRKLSKWKFIIKTDMKKAYFQIPMHKDSMQYVGTVTPFKGLRVYTRPPMGLPGSGEYLQELLSRVLGGEMQEGFVMVNADDMYVGGNDVDELLCNWSVVLEKMRLNNLKLNGIKTVVCPTETDILGWIWRQGTLSVSSHKISPLLSSDPPKTCSAMRSFLGAYKALSRCIPKYASLLSPLEESLKGLQGNQLIQWSDELKDFFLKAQDALRSPHVITIPTRSDPLLITTDGSPVNKGLGATLFILRNGKKLLSGFFSMKLKSHQEKWFPCEFEALAISAAIEHFGPYIRESANQVKIMTDSKPCVQAFNKLCKGEFSASARVSTFLSQLSSYNVSLHHIKGELNAASDYSSRHPIECLNKSCQICKFVEDTAASAVRSLKVEDVLSGNLRMPFSNPNAWKSAQQESHDMRRAFAHLSHGTRPSKKSRNINHLRSYLQKCTINDQGLIVHRKQDEHMGNRELIVVPHEVLPGLISALHTSFTHPTSHQMTKLFGRYFFGIGSGRIIKDVTANCQLCNSLKQVPKEIFEQSCSLSPTTVGSKFAADVIQRKKQSILAVRDVLSSYTLSCIVPDQTGDSLRAALILCTTPIRLSTCEIRLDNAPGLVTLKDDHLLKANGISLDFGRVKNINKNPVAERCNQELEKELLRMDPSGSPVTTLTLSTATDTLNSRIRHQGLSAKEIVFGRDQYTGAKLLVDGESISRRQEEIRKGNHGPSAMSKAKKKVGAVDAAVKEGDLVFIKSEGSKNNPRDRYIITNITGRDAILQKMNTSKFCSKKYEVPLSDLFPAIERSDHSPMPAHTGTPGEDTSSDEDDVYDFREVLSSESDSEGGESEGTGTEDEQDVGPSPDQRPTLPVTRPL